MVVYPRSDRWHKHPTPVLGGVAIYLSLILTYLIFLRVDGEIFSLILISSFVFLTGLLDDIFEISPPTKFLLQILASLLLIHAGFIMVFTKWYILNFVLTLFWLVGITNAFNLLDNMDGLSSGIALIATFFMMVFFVTSGMSPHFFLGMAFAGALLGFLIYNFNPASIFMGDAGSLFIGFFIAGLALSKNFTFTSNIFYVILIPAFILLVPIFDTTFVTITRTLSSKPVSQGGKDHTSHRLVSIGLTEKESVLVLYGLSIFAGFLAYIVFKYSLHISIIFIYLTLLIFIFIGIYLSLIRQTKEPPNEQSSTGPLIPILVDITFKKRLFEIAMDITLLTISSYSALLLRFESTIPPDFLYSFLKTLPLMIIIKLSALYVFGIYGGVWRYYGINDFIRLVQAIIIGSVVFITIIALIYRLEGFSRSALIIDMLLTTILLNGTRLSFRVLDRLLRQRVTIGKRVLIYGAGDGGELILREIFNNKELGLSPVGFIDDDFTKIGRKIHGIPVIGDYSSLHKIVQHYNIEEIIISTVKITNVRMSHITKFCKENNIRLRKLAIKLED
jgi:UDP-GlcNAc:undecaprenyl-phosphate GlcNAc-1-phosphate transferase